MRNLLISTAAAALVTTALPAFAQSAPMASGQARQQQPAAGQRDTGDAGARQVCLNIQQSNSRISRRVCRTEREWVESGDLDSRD